MTTSPQPLIATSPSGTLLALTNTSSKSSLIRCYDSTSSSLKFTLRIPKPDNDEEAYELQKLQFASDQFLVAQTSHNVVLVWDSNRGIASQIIRIDGKETLADIATQSAKLYALTYHGHGDKFKTRVMQYDCASGKLEKKIKVGSAKSAVLALDISGDVMAIRMGDVIKICDLNGEKLDKVDSPSGNDGSRLKYSSDGSYLLASGDGNVILFRVDKEKKVKLHPLAVFKSDGPVSYLDVKVTSKSIETIVFEYGARTLYHVIPLDQKTTKLDGMVPQSPRATIQSKIEHALISSTFHPIRNNEVLFVFRHTSNAPGSGTVLPMESLATDGEGISGSITLSPPADEDKTKKRKAGGAMAPGETGMEANMTTDLTSSKKTKESVEAVDEDGNDLNAEEEDEFELEDDEDGEVGQSIAERLAMLSSAMEQTDEEDFDDDDDDEPEAKRAKVQDTKSKFSAKTATTESLTVLLSQALSSNDSIRLNIALQVTDPRLVENTVKALQRLDAQRDDPKNTEGYIPMLMGHIVRRMARRHTLLTPLMSWIKAILLASSTSSRLQGVTDEEEERMLREGRELASKLGPLRNFLNERVECFPQLLRLEGRLALLGQQL
jgi:ribosomal protein L18